MTPDQLQIHFEQWAISEGLPLDKSQLPNRTYIWQQTEGPWFGFKGCYETLHYRECNDRPDSILRT